MVKSSDFIYLFIFIIIFGLSQNSRVSLQKHLPLYLFSGGETGISLPCSSTEKLSSQICMPQEHKMKSRFNT